MKQQRRAWPLSGTYAWITVGLIVLGVMLGTLGAVSVPLGMGITAFWPAIVVQICGGIWFGLWGGLVAAVIFPMLSNVLIGGDLVQVFGFIPANALQGLIPFWAFRHFTMRPAIPGWRGLVFFAFWGCLLPNLASALIGPMVLVLAGRLGWDGFPAFAWAWWFGNAVPAFLLGAPLLRYGSCMMEEMGLIVRHGWN